MVFILGEKVSRKKNLLDSFYSQFSSDQSEIWYDVGPIQFEHPEPTVGLILTWSGWYSAYCNLLL